jgi:hypothetical protein
MSFVADQYPNDDAGKRNGRRNEFSSRLVKEKGQGAVISSS